MTRTEMAEEIKKRDRLLENARSERDRYERAVRWALGETVPGKPDFLPRAEGDPPYWWRRSLREMAFGK